jgi:hypothetical protein
MFRTVQLAVVDTAYAAALRESLLHSGPWHVDCVEDPDPALPQVLVVDEIAFNRLPSPLPNPERVVLIMRHDPDLMAQAWEAGIVSVVSNEDPLSTVLLAVMAAALRITNFPASSLPSGISPNHLIVAAPLSPHHQSSRSRRCKTR